MKTLNCLRALFFRDIRTLFRSVLAAELGTIGFWIFLMFMRGEEYLGYAVLMIPALCVPVLLMKRETGVSGCFPIRPGRWCWGNICWALLPSPWVSF